MGTKSKDIKVNDRVRRAKAGGILGVVKEIRLEIQPNSGEPRDRTKMVNVLWDNGTLSYFDPDSLELVEVE